MISAEVMETRWDPSKIYSNEERLRIYEERLNGKLQDWQALVKFTITNLTDHNLLILSTNSHFSKPESTVSPFVKQEGVKPYAGSTRKYDLMKKCLLNYKDPIELPAKAQIGIVIVAYCEIDRSVWVDQGPSQVTISVKLDDGRTHEKEVRLAEAVEMSEVDWVYGDDPTEKKLHWVPYLVKNEISRGIPF